eukprot:scaffold29902_cov60-Phaeocystis_antarctica.AAC.3
MIAEGMMIAPAPAQDNQPPVGRGSPLDLRNLLGHDARVAETVDEQRPRLGRQAGVRAVAAPGPEGRAVR